MDPEAHYFTFAYRFDIRSPLINVSHPSTKSRLQEYYDSQHTKHPTEKSSEDFLPKALQ